MARCCHSISTRQCLCNFFCEGHAIGKNGVSVSSENGRKYPGIIGHITTGWQGEKININNASAVVLQALHGDMTAEFASAMVEFRQQEENSELLQQKDWYTQVSSFPGDIALDQEMITTTSSYFQVTVTAEMRGLQRTGEGVIWRKENQEQQLLSWKMK